jgi:hypothetical protein
LWADSRSNFIPGYHFSRCAVHHLTALNRH